MLTFLASSVLFDRNFYLSSNQDVAASGHDPLEHFFDLGFREQRNPNFYFDVAWYMAENEVLLQGDTHPLVHYALEGEARGRRPSKFFDPVWYKTRYGLLGTESALGHFLANRTSCLFSPIPEFDALYYGQNHPDVANAEVDPFEHFYIFGHLEGRNPFADFDMEFYKKRYLADNPAQHPFLHYLHHKNDPGHITRPLKFDFETRKDTVSSEPPREQMTQIAPEPAPAPKPAEPAREETAAAQASARPNWR